MAMLVLGFAKSFSSTVFAFKVLEDKCDMSAFDGKVAIGIWVMLDVFAVVFLAVSDGKYPPSNSYRRFKWFWDRFQRGTLQAKDQMLNTGDALVLVIGMGRVGTEGR